MSIAPVECTPGVDWLTVRTEANPQSQRAFEVARNLQAFAVRDGDKLRDWGTHGYFGKSTRHCRWGVKGEEVLVELSGHLAQDHWRGFVELATSIPRLDTKVDVRFPHPVTDLAIEAYAAPGVRINDRLPPIAKALYTGTAGGQTCYVGAMGGRRLGRLYDKSAESPRDTPPGVWRYELQERRPFSDVAGRAVDRSDDVPGAIAAYVHRYFARHGIQPRFNAERHDLPDIPRPQHSDVSAWLDWLSRQVAPGMRRWVGRGYGDAIRRVLAEDGGLSS